MDARIFKEIVPKYLDEEKTSDVYEALEWSSKLLEGSFRYSGEPIINHSIGVAAIELEEIGLGRRSVIATLFHDSVRLGLISSEEVGKAFGDKVKEILSGLTRISQVDPKISVLQEDNFKELIVSYSTDPRIILIKLADRLEVMRSLDMFPSQKRTKKSWETLHLYAPLAHKLGLYSIKSEMEDLSLKFLEPESYHYILKCLHDSEDERLRFIDSFVKPIKTRMDSLGISYKLKARTKSVYSIWRKMKKQNVDFNGVYDVFAIRIIADCPHEIEKMQCWTIFSIVTDFYTPNPDRMRDWISIPKSNGYESLHTTVVTTEGKWVEVQIRTTRMDDIAEHGVAAHWRYKGVSDGTTSSAEWLMKVRDVVEASEGSVMTEEFDFTSASSEVFVFTPKGDLRKLPIGATLLDFAFDIHSDVGSSCTGGKVNGKNVPIRYVLHNGDIVEVATSKNQTPKVAWLSIVVTSKARNRIQQILRQMEAEQAQIGREELERKIRNWKLDVALEPATSALTKSLKIKTANELYGLISTGKLPMTQVKNCLMSFLSDGDIIQQTPQKAKKIRSKGANDYIEIDGYGGGMDYKLGKCCNPVYGDQIFGFVTVSAGITIHRRACPNANRLITEYPYRVIQAKWKENSGSFLVTLCFTADDRNGLAADITELISTSLKFEIRQLSISASGNDAKGEITLSVGTKSQVDMLLASLKRIKGIKNTYRKS